jgi:hypothetical protein
MSACLLYILYCGITLIYNWALLVALAAIFAEGAALILNRWRCPLTTLVERYSGGKGSVTDLFLPDIIARNTFRYSTFIFAAELLLLAVGYFCWRGS